MFYFHCFFNFAHVLLVCQQDNSREADEAGVELFFYVGGVNFLGDNIVTSRPLY
jgi:hypothetical protein